MEDAMKDFELTRRFSDYFYKKCRYIDRQIFDEMDLIHANELVDDIASIIDFVYYYRKGYEAAHSEKEE